MDEAFVCYVAMTRAKGDVTFSYSLMGSSGDDKEISPFLNQIQSLFNQLEITNIPQYHEVNPLSLMQHAKQTKITLFEALRAWLYDEIVADSWLDAYQVIRDSDHLNQGLDYLMSALTFDNENCKIR